MTECRHRNLRRKTVVSLARAYLDTRELLDRMKAEKVAAYKDLAQSLGFTAETD